MRLGRYELLGKLATGGMAEIYLARLRGEAGFEKVVVVKRLLPELVASQEFVAMFLDEGKLVASIDHPNVCDVHELGRDGAEYFLVMPYLDGVPASDFIARPREPDRLAQIRVAAGIVAQACAGLHHAHELRGYDGQPLHLVHRDVSPSNLFVTAAGIVKVLDFGIAKVRSTQARTEVGTVKGKTQYMAPEQLLGKPLDRRCDVFALGIVLFELVTHQRLFKRASDFLDAKAVIEDPIPRADAVDPAVPKALADVIARALERDPDARFADARELAAAITAAIAPASPAEIAAALTAGHREELTAQRTRKAHVIEDAQSQLATTPRTARRARWIVPVAIGAVTVGSVTAFVLTRGNASVGPDAAIATRRGDAAVDAAVDAAADAMSDAMPPPDAAPPPRVPPGRFSIDSTPYATIYVDGALVGDTPLLDKRIPAGRHQIQARTKDGRSKTFVIDVPPGKRAKPVNLTW
jgi:serine/threonine-protein kinase